MNTTVLDPTVKATHAVGACPNCGCGVAAEAATTTCPECGAKVTLQWVYGVNSDIPCDGRCQSAIRNLCACSCGGANHGRMFLNVHMVPVFIRERDRNRHAAKVARREAKAQTAAQRIAAAKAELLDEHPLLECLLLPDDLDEEFRGWLMWNTFMSDLRRYLNRDGTLTDRQVGAAERAILGFHASKVRKAEWDAREAELVTAGVRCPTGRLRITGEIVTAKVYEGAYGTSYKMLVVTGEGWKVWGTIPSCLYGAQGWLDRLRGRRVSFDAAVAPSDKDPLFGGFKRPTKVVLESE